MDTHTRDTVTTSLTSFEILQTIRRFNGAGVTQIATHLDLGKSTVHRHLSTLEEAEYLVKEDDEYHLSLRFLSLGEHARSRKRAHRIAKEKVNQLASETGERAQFMVEEHGHAVYVHTALGAHAVKTDSEVGKHIPMNAVSAGKAVLAELPEERVREIIRDHGLPKRTENTITDEEQLFKELETIREQGYALNFSESTEGLRAISVPVKGTGGSVIGAFGVSGPTHRMNNDRIENELSGLLLGVSNELKLDVQFEIEPQE